MFYFLCGFNRTSYESAESEPKALAPVKKELTFEERVAALPDLALQKIGLATERCFRQASKKHYSVVYGSAALEKLLQMKQVGRACLTADSVDAIPSKLYDPTKVTAIELDLTYIYQSELFIQRIEQIAAKFPLIQDLRLRGQSAFIVEFFRHFPNLTTLSIADSSMLTDGGIQNILENLPLLSNLQLANCIGLGARTIQLLANPALELRRIDLSKCPQFTATELAGLAGNTNLRYLKVYPNFDIDRVLLQLKQLNPNLITEKCEQTALAKAKNLVEGMARFTDSTMTAAVQTFNRYRNPILYTLGAVALVAIGAILRNQALAQSAAKAIQASNNSAASQLCKATFRYIPEAHESNWRLSTYCREVLSMQSQSRLDCLKNYVGSDKDGFMRQFLPLCSSWAQTTPGDTLQQREALGLRIEQEIQLQRDYQLQQVEKSREAVNSYVGATIKKALLPDAVRAEILEGAELGAREHCAAQLAKHRYAQVVQAACLGSTAELRAERVQGLTESDLWPNVFK